MMIRMLSHETGQEVSRFEKHEAIADLKDGTILTGYWGTRKTSRKTYIHEFHPHRKQPDGSVWVSAAACDPAKLPGDKKVFYPSDLDYVQVEVTPRIKPEWNRR